LRPRGRIAFLPRQKPRWRAPRRRSKWYGDERRRCLESRTEGLQRSCLTHARRSVKRRRLHDDRASCRRRTAEPNRGSRILGLRTPRCVFLTVKLRGRTTTPDKRRGRTLSPGARGAKQATHHGPLERLLEVTLTTTTVRVRHRAGNRSHLTPKLSAPEGRTRNPVAPNEDACKTSESATVRTHRVNRSTLPALRGAESPRSDF